MPAARYWRRSGRRRGAATWNGGAGASAPSPVRLACYCQRGLDLARRVPGNAPDQQAAIIRETNLDLFAALHPIAAEEDAMFATEREQVVFTVCGCRLHGYAPFLSFTPSNDAVARAMTLMEVSRSSRASDSSMMCVWMISPGP